MGKKEKEKKSVKSGNVSKNEVKNKSKGKSEGRKEYCCLIVTSVIILVKAILAYKIYQAVMVIPDMPKLDLDAWWGPNNTRINQDTTIRPYRVVFTDAMLTDLRKRFENYRGITKTKSLQDTAWTYGINSEAFGQFFAHWLFKYDFRARQRYLNKYNHYLTNIQGLDIHYVHVKPVVDKKIKVIPLLLLHGWPGSFREFYEAIPLLTTVRSDRDFVFEVIVPSLPGYGFSQAPVRPGLSPAYAAIIMDKLMERLGFQSYYIQGGDLGHIIGTNLATLFPHKVSGFHTNMPIILTKATGLAWILGSIWPTVVENNFTDRMYPLGSKISFYLEESGYAHMHFTKPDTLGIALYESPVGLAAYILEKFVLGTNYTWKNRIDGGIIPELAEDDELSQDMYLDKDGILDNIMIYWSSGCITSSMRFYKEIGRNYETEKTLLRIPTKVPTWGLRLKHEIFFMSEWLLKWKYPNLLGTTTLEYGGHFAAFELPKVYADDVFRAVKRFEEFHKTR